MNQKGECCIVSKQNIDKEVLAVGMNQKGECCNIAKHNADIIPLKTMTQKGDCNLAKHNEMLPILDLAMKKVNVAIWLNNMLVFSSELEIWKSQFSNQL